MPMSWQKKKHRDLSLPRWTPLDVYECLPFLTEG